MIWYRQKTKNSLLYRYDTRLFKVGKGMCKMRCQRSATDKHWLFALVTVENSIVVVNGTHCQDYGDVWDGMEDFEYQVKLEIGKLMWQFKK